MSFIYISQDALSLDTGCVHFYSFYLASDNKSRYANVCVLTHLQVCKCISCINFCGCYCGHHGNVPINILPLYPPWGDAWGNTVVSQARPLFSLFTLVREQRTQFSPTQNKKKKVVWPARLGAQGNQLSYEQKMCSLGWGFDLKFYRTPT